MKQEIVFLELNYFRQLKLCFLHLLNLPPVLVKPSVWEVWWCFPRPSHLCWNLSHTYTQSLEDIGSLYQNQKRLESVTHHEVKMPSFDSTKFISLCFHLSSIWLFQLFLNHFSITWPSLWHEHLYLLPLSSVRSILSKDYANVCCFIGKLCTLQRRWLAVLLEISVVTIIDVSHCAGSVMEIMTVKITLMSTTAVSSLFGCHDIVQLLI